MIYTLPQIIESSARRFPEKEAFRCGTDSLTFTEMNVKMNQLAFLLGSCGIAKGDRVGILMNRCLESALAVYGIMKAGAVFVPLDPLAPDRRISFQLADCGIKCLVTNPLHKRIVQRQLGENSSLEAIVGLQVDGVRNSCSWDEVFSIIPDSYKPVNILEQDLAYIMYTSGTTGTPKGIMHTHYSGLSYARLSADLYKVTQDDRVGNHAPLYFDIATFGYFTAPLAGATTVIIKDAYTKLPASLSGLMEQEKLTIWYSVPLALVQLLLHGVLQNRDLGALRWVLFGGEHFSAKYLASLMAMWPHARFSNVYGPAEVNQCTYFNLETPPGIDDPIPIGQVWGNTEYKILSDDDSVATPGTAGELVIRSATMMKGYWNNPELSSKSFYRTTDSAGQVQLFYRTGDLVKTDDHGWLVLLGRKDSQIKIRGYRVEPDEIEAILKMHPGVQDAVVITTENHDGEKELLAAVIPMPESKPEQAGLLKHCRNILPPYAVPQRILVIPDFPRTPSEKIDRRQIKELLSEQTYE